MQSSGQKIKLVFFGNERIATGVVTTAPTLQMLIDEGFDVCAVVVSEKGSNSRGAQELAVEKLANDNHIPLINAHSNTDYHLELAKLKPTIGVLVAFGRIVPQSVIDIFPKGILNIHPSLLPKHRGSIPIESAILSGDETTGVSIMNLERKMDAGSIYGQAQIDLDGTESKQFLADTLLEIGGALLKEVIPLIIEDTAAPVPQDDSSATYDKLITKENGRIDTSKPAVQLEREIRAYLEWPKSKINIAGVDTIITATHTSDTPSKMAFGAIFINDKELCLQTSDGVLIIDKLKPSGKPEMTSTAFLAGYGNKL